MKQKKAIDLPDIEVANHGSIYLIRPLTEVARAWFANHLPDDAQMFGPSTVVEHRFIKDILEGASADGLSLRFI